ncbi:MAG: energy-coupling factor ABC transporter ATP-binding protein, partial [Hyphomicrobiales bacterium]
ESRLAARARDGAMALFRTHQDAEAPFPGERLLRIENGAVRGVDGFAPRDVLEAGAVPLPLALRVSALLATRRLWEGPLVLDAASLAARLGGVARGGGGAGGGAAGRGAAAERAPGGSAGTAGRASGDVVLELSGVGVTPRGTRGAGAVLAGFDLALRAGEVVALIGASGSGKTTALHVAAGLRDPVEGEASRGAGAAPVALALEYPERQLFGRTVEEDVAVALWIAGLAPSERARRAAAALRDIGLDPEAFAPRVPSTLSEGEKRRAALAGFLVDPPRALLLDEPTAGLDPAGRRSLRAALETLRASGRAILFASHDLDFVSAVADRVIVLGREPGAPGRILGEGTPGAVWNDPALLARAGLPAPDHVAVGNALAGAGWLPEAPATGADDLLAALAGATVSLTGHAASG